MIRSIFASLWKGNEKKQTVFLTFTKANEQGLLKDVLPQNIINYLLESEKIEAMRERCRCRHLPPEQRNQEIAPAKMEEQNFYNLMCEDVAKKINQIGHSQKYVFTDVFDNSWRNDTVEVSELYPAYGYPSRR